MLSKLFSSQPIGTVPEHEVSRLVRVALRMRGVRWFEVMGVIGVVLASVAVFFIYPPAGIAAAVLSFLWLLWLISRFRKSLERLASRAGRRFSPFLGLKHRPDGAYDMAAFVQDLGMIPSGKRYATSFAVDLNDDGFSASMAGVTIRDDKQKWQWLDAADGPIGLFLVAIYLLYTWLFRVKGYIAFQGAVFVAAAPKQFESGVHIQSRDWPTDENLPSNWERVSLEDPKFIHAFDVFAVDQIEARYLLTPSDMERILHLRQELGCPLCLRFHAGALYLTIETESPVFSFEDASWDRASLTHRANRIIGEMQYFQTLCEDLGLSRKTRA